MAEARGLMHESVGEGGERRLVVWKPSRSRRQALGIAGWVGGMHTLNRQRMGNGIHCHQICLLTAQPAWRLPAGP